MSNISAMSPVLICGHSETLLNIRTRLLQKCGYQAEVAMSMSDVRARLGAEKRQYSLLIPLPNDPSRGRGSVTPLGANPGHTGL